MDKKLKDKVFYVLIFIFVFILPNVFFYWKSSSDSEVFHQRVTEDHQFCVRRAERDSLDTRWCDEIRSASRETFSATKNSNDIFLLMSLFHPVLFVLIMSIRNLGKQIEELKEKINA
jgi:hypothetical protein